MERRELERGENREREERVDRREIGETHER